MKHVDMNKKVYVNVTIAITSASLSVFFRIKCQTARKKKSEIIFNPAAIPRKKQKESLKS